VHIRCRHVFVPSNGEGVMAKCSLPGMQRIYD
jgi:hypothetical protein